MNAHLKRGSCGNEDGHIKIERVPCNQCDKTFSSKQEMSKHVKKIHIGEKDKKCDMCSYASYSTYNLKSHVSKRHVKILQDLQD